MNSTRTLKSRLVPPLLTLHLGNFLTEPERITNLVANWLDGAETWRQQRPKYEYIIIRKYFLPRFDIRGCLLKAVTSTERRSNVDCGKNKPSMNTKNEKKCPVNLEK